MCTQQQLVDFQLNLGWTKRRSVLYRSYPEPKTNYKINLGSKSWALFRQDGCGNWQKLHGGPYTNTVITKYGLQIRWVL